MRLPGGRALATQVTAAVDRIVEGRDGPAIESVHALRASRPDASPAQLAEQIVTRHRRELAGMGAVSGGVAALPGVGTAALIVGSVSESGWTLVRLGQMILELGIVHGHAGDVEVRRTWVLAVLALAMSATARLDGPAGLIARPGGAAALGVMRSGEVTRLQGAILGRLLVRWGAAQAAMRLGNAAPFGIGAAVGAGTNTLLVTMVGSRARSFIADDVQLRLAPATLEA